MEHELEVDYVSLPEEKKNHWSSYFSKDKPKKIVKNAKRNFALNCRSQRSLLTNKPIVLLLLWNTMVFGYQYIVLRLLSGGYNSDKKSYWLNDFSVLLFQFVFSDLFYPLAGWLSDTKLGRYRVMKYSIWLMWFSSGIALLSLIPPSLGSSRENEIISQVMKLVVLAINSISLAGFNVNIILFGLNHLIDASSDQCGAFIRWYYWTRNVSFLALSILNVTVCIHSKYFMLISVTASALLLSLALGSDFIFGYILKVHYKKSNPFRLIRRVLMYALKHRYPESRSAFTFNDRFQPKRIDYAKEIYGGPFSYEQVEDVKSFLNLLFAIVAIGIFSFIYLLSYSSIHYFINRITFTRDQYFYIINEVRNCWPLDNLYFIVNPLIITVLIPVFEFLLVPCLDRYVPRTLRRIGLAIGLLFVALVSLLLLDIIGARHDIKNIEKCHYTKSISNTTGVLHTNVFLVLIPVTFSTLAEMLGRIAALEFICAQTPEIFKGFVMGLLFAVQGIFNGFGTFLVAPFINSQYVNQISHSGIHCPAGFYSLHIFLSICALIGYIIVVRRYQRRQRNPIINQQQLVESRYEHMFDERDKSEATKPIASYDIIN